MADIYWTAQQLSNQGFWLSCREPHRGRGPPPAYRKMRDNRRVCFAYAHAEEDPCPEVSKYLEMVYSCEQKDGVFLTPKRSPV